MLQNTVRIIQQQDRCQWRCWEPHYDESHFISCHSRCLTNNYICPGSVVHELIITYHQSSERSCQRQIISVYHAASACSSKSKQTAKRNGEANMRRLLYFTVCGLKRWRSVSQTGDTLKNRTISTGCQKETASPTQWSGNSQQQCFLLCRLISCSNTLVSVVRRSVR